MKGKNVKYRIGGKSVSIFEISAETEIRLSKITDPDLKKFYIERLAKTFDQDLLTNSAVAINDIKKDNRSHIMQTVVWPLVGLFGLIGMVWLAITNPFPSSFQTGVFWSVLCLAAAAFAALIPGFLEVSWAKWARAGGALAVFFIMYNQKPDIMKGSFANKSETMRLFVASNDTTKVETIPIDFDRDNNIAISDFTAKTVERYYGRTNGLDTFLCYRKSDGMIYQTEQCKDIQDLDVLMISSKLLPFYKDNREAYLHFNGLIK